MPKITAKFEYRTFIPVGWIANEFCHLTFYGDNTDEWMEAWDDIRYKKYHEKQKQQQQLTDHIIELRKEIAAIQPIEIHKKFFIIPYTIKYYPTKIEKLNEIDDCTDQLKEANDNLFETAVTLMSLGHVFLKMNNFVLTSTATSTEGLGTITELYERDEQ